MGIEIVLRHCFRERNSRIKKPLTSSLPPPSYSSIKMYVYESSAQQLVDLRCLVNVVKLVWLSVESDKKTRVFGDQRDSTHG